MTFSKRTQYGLRAMICLADAYEHGYLQTKELAKREKLPGKFLESILSALARGKFLESRIGVTGGFRLARPPTEISVGDIVDRLEGTRFTDDQRPHAGERPGELGVRLMQLQLSATLKKFLDDTSLSALADQVSQRSGGQMYYI